MAEKRVGYPKEIKFSLYVLTAIAFIVGYGDLWRGGISVSACLLALGYCALVPAVILVSGVRPAVGAEEVERPSYQIAAIVGVAVFALYVATMAPNTAMWDTSEYIAAAYTFGLPHPPGNPLFVIVGRMFSILPIATNIAARINVLAAASSAAAAAFWFLTTEQIAGQWLGRRWLRVTVGALGALIGATAFTVWNQSVVNEKVYTVSLAGIAVVSWLMIRWSAAPSDASSDRLLVLAAYLCGLGYANHMAGMLPAPAIALAVLLRRPATVIRWRLLATCVFAMIVGLSPFATQPIRAAHFPAMNEGEPTACRVKLELKCTLSADTYRIFRYNFDRGQYGKPDLSERQAGLGEQIGMWWLYFRWQWIRDADVKLPALQSMFAAIFFVLGLSGAWVHFKRDRRTFWYFGALMITVTLLLIYYLNFKLGASQDPDSQAPHEVRDRDYFYLWSFSAWGVWAAIGLAYLWETLAALAGVEERRMGKEVIAEPTQAAWVRASPIALLAVVPLFANESAASRAHHQTTRNVAADLLNSVEPYGVLITVGDNDTFPLWYAQEVEGVRRDVTVAVTSLLNTDWYARQIIRRPIYEYDAAKGPAIYRDKVWPKPAQPALHMTLDEADAIQAWYDIRTPMSFTAGPYRAIVDPKKLEHGVLERADVLVLHMISDGLTERPFYFSRSSGGYPRALGLGDYVLTQGLAQKLFVPPASPSRDTIAVQSDGWMDVKRSQALWDSVFAGHRSTVAEKRWVDRPSANMALMYVFAGAELGDALRMRGDAASIEESKRVLSLAKATGTAAGYGPMVAGLDQPLPSVPTIPGDSSGVSLPLRGQPAVKATEPAIGRKRK